MEDDRKLLSLPPYPCLAFIRGNDRELLTFCPIEENGGGVVEKNTPDHLLDHNHIWNCCHGWLILSDAEEIHYSLWSPAATIHLPALPLNSEQEIGYCILTSPPGNSDSMVVLLEITGPSFFYCKVGDQQWTWTEQQEKEYPVMLDGRILFCTKNMGQVQGVGTIDIKPDRLAFRFLELEPPCLDVPWEHLKEYLVESCGEIFSITLRLNGDYEWNEVIAVYAFKLDSSRREWERVQSFKDRAFFLGSYPLSCPATQTGIKGNHVYFQLSNDPTLYSYNMEDGTVLFSMPCPNLSEWSTSFWVIQNLGRLSKDAGGEIKSDVPDDAGDEIKSKNREIVKHCTIEQADFDKLPLEILTKIGRCLGWQDYMRFRAVNTRFRSAAPIQRWRNDTCLPWLISWRLGDSIWDFVDPLHEGRYFMTPNKELEDITALTCYPKGDWCVMFHGQDSVFLWNPFSKKTIQLPNLQLPNVRIDFNCDTLSVAGCNFSSSPDSLESDCTIVVLFNLWVEYRINFINLGGKEWKSYSFRHNGGIKLYKDNPLVFYNGAVYFLDENGNLGIYREIGDEEDGEREGGGHVRYGDGDGDGDGDEAGDGDGEGEADGHGDEIGDEDEEGDGDEDEDGEEEAEGHGDEIGDEDEDREVLDHVVLSPCKTFHQKFLLECNGKLLSVFVGFVGEWVEIFSLDENKKVWVEVEDLGNHTICLSRFSAFSMVAPPGLQNRIYFPRFYGKNSVVYYSLESMQLHAHGIDEVLEDFYDTKEQLLCGWITPRFLFTD